MGVSSCLVGGGGKGVERVEARLTKVIRALAFRRISDFLARQAYANLGAG